MLIFLFQLACSTLFRAPNYTENGTEYGEKAVVTCTQSNHGLDRNLFSRPLF